MNQVAVPASGPIVEMDPRRRLAAIVESSDDAIISKTLEGVILTWNQGAQRLFGYEAAEIVGQSVFLLVPDAGVEELQALHARIARGERVPAFPSVRRCKDGSLVDVLVSISPVYDDDGRVVGASTNFRDISGRLREQRDRELLLELTSAMLSEADPGAMIDRAAARIAAYLDVAHCFFGDVDSAGLSVTYRPVPAPSGAAGREVSCPLDRLGHAAVGALAAGVPYTITDAEHDENALILPVLGGPGLPATRALLRVPLLRNGRLAALVELRAARARAWGDHEIALAESALERLWPLVQMAQARVAEHAAHLGLERL